MSRVLTIVPGDMAVTDEPELLAIQAEVERLQRRAEAIRAAAERVIPARALACWPGATSGGMQPFIGWQRGP